MIRVGGKHLLKVCCPECGTPSHQPYDSDFFFICCQNEKCLYRYANIGIERPTGVVVSCDAMVTFDGAEWKRVFPTVCDDNGKTIWPKREENV